MSFASRISTPENSSTKDSWCKRSLFYRAKSSLRILDARLDQGFTLIEGLVVSALISIASLIIIPSMYPLLADYRLTLGTRQLSTAIQYSRGKAVSENYVFTINMTGTPGDTPDTYQIVGGEVDTNGNGLEPWEDRNNNGVLDQKTYSSTNLPKGIDYYPSDTPMTPVLSTTNPSVTYPDISAASISFNPLGIAFLNNEAIVYLQNESGDKAAITVDNAGRVQSWRFRNSQWVLQ